MKRLFLSLLVVGGAVALGTAPHAQPGRHNRPQTANAREAAADTSTPVRILQIRAGKLLLDGVALPPSAVPEDLDLDGYEMTVQFSGPVLPVIEMDGQAYVLENERLVRFEDTGRDRSQVYFLGQPIYVGEADEAEAARAAGPPPPAPAPMEPMPEREMRRVSEAAYLHDLSARDRALYERIQREQHLEAETLELARRLRQTSEGPARAALRRILREKLDASFELKQEIRRDEIERVEEQLGELQRLLAERAARKHQIIAHRYRELTGEDLDAAE
ncbi:MAG TPA: hypothetical protein VD962_05845 [Rubricoccaceae bacterium]|nr:hypothetical protein [Rubricoccaceae bacterium]